jgi:hypothetical protein
MVVPSEEPKKSRKPQKPAKPNKSRERSRPVPVPASSAGLSVLNPDAAGIDVHSNMHMICVPADRDANPVRQFGANTADLQEATAHKLACLVYRMLKYGQEYVTQSMEEYEAKVTANILKSLKRKAAMLGFQLSPLPTQ